MLLFERMRYLFLLLLMTTSAFAQQLPLQSPLEQALGQKLMAEINSSLGCEMRVIALQKQIDEQKKELDARKPAKAE